MATYTFKQLLKVRPLAPLFTASRFPGCVPSFKRHGNQAAPREVTCWFVESGFSGSESTEDFIQVNAVAPFLFVRASDTMTAVSSAN